MSENTGSVLQVGVKALILSEDLSHFLAIKRNADKILTVQEEYDIPGGRIEFAEEPLEGLKREFQEEINYVILTEPILIDAANIFVSAERQVIRLTYAIKEGIKISDIRLGDEHTHAKMLPLQESGGFNPVLNSAIRRFKSLI